jgi:hypothetical protein
MKPSATGSFSVEIASVPDRDDLVAEVWMGRELVAELRYEENELRLQLYAGPGGSPWDLPCEPFLRALQEAQERLRPR